MEHTAQQDVPGSLTTTKAPWAALVIDDDAGVRQSLRLCLEAAGARVLGVATGRAALEALDRGHFDVVFLDLWLGADAGMELLPEILARQPDVGVIVVTAYASIESAVNAIRRGAVDYVPKPFTPDQIRLAAHRVVEAQRLRRRLAELQEELDESGEPAFFESRSPLFLAVPANSRAGSGLGCCSPLERRERHRQERPRSLGSREQPAVGGAICHGQLSGAVRRPDDECALRAPQGRVHRRGGGRGREGPGRRGRNAAPR